MSHSENDDQHSDAGKGPGPAAPNDDRRSPEEIQRDIRVYAEKNPRRGGLHGLSQERAQDRHTLERFHAREAMQANPTTKNNTVVKEHGFCRKHPFVKTNWRCADCGREFCEDCVTPQRHLMSHQCRTAVCPECKGRCVDFQLLEDLAAEERVQEEQKQRIDKRLLIAFGAVALVFLFYPAPWMFMVLLVSLFWFGPLREVDLNYKLGSVAVSLALMNPLLTARLELAGMVGPLVYVRYLVIAAILFIGMTLLDKLVTTVSGMLTGAPAVDEQSEWKRGYFAGAVAIVVLVILLVTYR